MKNILLLLAALILLLTLYGCGDSDASAGIPPAVTQAGVVKDIHFFSGASSSGNWPSISSQITILNNGVLFTDNSGKEVLLVGGAIVIGQQ